MFQYLLYRFAHRLFTCIPLALSYWIADRIGDLHFLFCFKSRRQVLKNLRWIHNGVRSQHTRDARQVFRNFGEYLVDFFQLSRVEREEFLRRVEVRGLEHIQRSLEKGKGAIGVTAHFGNWEWGSVGLSLLGYPVHALALSHRNPWVNNFFVNQRSRKGVHVIPIDDSIWEPVQILTRNEILLLVADRVFSNNGVPVSFLGRKVYFPPGPAALSRRCGSPLVVGFVIRREKGCFQLIFEPPIAPERTEDVSSDLQRMTQKVASLLESTIRRYPTQWFLFQGFRECS